MNTKREKRKQQKEKNGTEISYNNVTKVAFEK